MGDAAWRSTSTERPIDGVKHSYILDGREGQLRALPCHICAAIHDRTYLEAV